MPSVHSWRGFSLVEALVAALILSTAVIGAVHLLAVGARQGMAARQATTSRVLAQSKLEQLRALAWGYDASGARLTSADLATSPDSSLTEDAEGFVERLDRFGAVVTSDAAAEFRRRWAIAPLPDDPDTLVIRVCVFAAHITPGRLPEACVWSMRTRRP